MVENAKRNISLENLTFIYGTFDNNIGHCIEHSL